MRILGIISFSAGPGPVRRPPSPARLDYFIFVADLYIASWFIRRSSV